MPRTVESIVDSHMAARARRAAGKPAWELTLPLKALMEPYKSAGDDMTAEQAVELSYAIAAMLKTGVPADWRKLEHANYSLNFEEVFERFEQAVVGDFSPDEYNDSPADSLNNLLEELYDWGDRYRVWFGA